MLCFQRNGIERLKQGIGVETDIESLDIQTKYVFFGNFIAVV